MKKRRLALMLSALALGLLLASDLWAAEIPRMTKEELKPLLGKPDVIVIDVRTGSDWAASEFKIKGAVREDTAKLSAWIDKFPKDKTLVFYCAWPNEATSARVAQQLMEKGYSKVYALKGGWHEWFREKFPVDGK